MHRIFYIGIVGLVLFEVLKIYFIMPMPGSQEMNSIDVAYFIDSWKWTFRFIFAIFILVGAFWAYKSKPTPMLISLVVCLVVVCLFNFKLKADKMFYQPNKIVMADSRSNSIPMDKLVIGIHFNGEYRAYPIQLIAYHHQVMDTVTGNPIMVTYCSVCRTGRVFEPKVKGRSESFRLVGMDHYNAMFEDKTTKSWWRQATGEAIAGPLKGEVLPELMSEQTTLEKWLELYPESTVLQPDSAFDEEYEDLKDYDFGIERGDLTRTDTLSWQEKSWVVGIQLGDSSRAIDWNKLKEERIINFTISGKPLFVALASDNQSFFAFERPDDIKFDIKNDTLINSSTKYNLLGLSLSKDTPPLKRVKAYQEFWHSWRTFHPGAKKIE